MRRSGRERLISCRTCSVNLQDVVRGADQRPLRADLLDAAQQELAEALRLFDLPEDRLDDGLAPRVDGLARLGLELSFHPCHQRGRFRDASPGTACCRLIVLLFIRCHV